MLNTRALAAGGTAHAIADLSGVHVQLGKGAAEGIAVHAELFSGLALIALVVSEDLKDVTLLELANGFRVGDTGAVHLCNESIQFALQSCLACRPIFLGSDFRLLPHCEPNCAV